MSPELSAALIALTAAAVRLAERELQAWRHRTGRVRERASDNLGPLERRREGDRDSDEHAGSW